MILTPLSFQYSSTIAYMRSDLRTLVSDEAAYGRSVPTDTTKLARVDASIKLGSQWWYNPGQLDEVGTHEWSFLKPFHSFTTVEGQGDYDLPFDYAGHEGKITFGPQEGWKSIPFVAPYRIEEARQQNGSTTGYPIMASVTIARRDIPQGQLYVLSLYPAASAAWALKFKMNVIPPDVSDAYPFVYGSAVHSDCVLMACFAAFEFLYRKGERSRYDAFVRRLLAAIELDRKTIRQEFIGYNANYSDRRRGRRSDGYDASMNPNPSTLTFNGATV